MKLKLILFDLDNTLINRRNSIAVFVEHFIDKYDTYLGDISPSQIEAVFFESDKGGYNPRSLMLEAFINVIPWNYRPSVDELVLFWNQQFPYYAQIMKGAYDLLNYLQLKNIRIGVVTNGIESLQMTKIKVTQLSHYITTVASSNHKIKE